MNKARLETLSDGVFAIVMTVLILNVHIPNVPDGAYSVLGLWNALTDLFPLIMSYMVAFTVLALYWTSHHAFFHFFTKTVDRTLTQLNMLYLMFLVFIPFTSELLGMYQKNILAIWVFGANILVLGAVAYGMYTYALRSGKVELFPMTHHEKVQTMIRILLTPAFALLGMLVAFFSIPLAFLLLIIPVIFNLLPTTLGDVERMCGVVID